MQENLSEETSAEEKLVLKPLSSNPIAAFFQKIWRWWQGVWCGFTQRHPKLSSWIYKVGFFIIFSEGVTIWQYIVMTFLPYALTGLGTDPWGWSPFEIMGQPCTILGDTSGLGYFVAYEIAVFTAQCINFPLQRNITYRSHGNPWWQAMWYFIGWVIISLVMNLIWGVVNCFMLAWAWPAAVIGLVKTIITGGVSMVIFFFIFLIIFPNVDKDAEKKAKKAEQAKGTPNEEKAALAATKAEEVRLVFHAEKDIAAACSLAESKISAYLSIKKLYEQGKAEETKVAEAKSDALKAVESRDKIVAEQSAVLQSVKEAREKRAAA